MRDFGLLGGEGFGGFGAGLLGTIAGESFRVGVRLGGDTGGGRELAAAWEVARVVVFSGLLFDLVSALDE
ncbi:hypothetical protein BD309DRAFT_868750 [Dichomitus squalens]|uniref:Uncharacterized protein n=1 Tax=Dichomitus squalens TaxID=114155 RepID=A0A4Q9NKR1_9APHY|nr:hypothetical protein BD309DRAFT_868750 [Dichomitus squalens]TBU63565.1 hypothetical protein BD310DRAFT_945108 [Dichomitus squalens]